MSCEHHHHSHHSDSHHHDETSSQSSGKLSDREKLAKMVEHWIHHNEDHARSFREWADRARSMGEPEVARILGGVAEEAGGQNRNLKKALDLLNHS